MYEKLSDLKGLKKIVVYGGSFDPPHLAHVVLPKLVMKKIGTEAVVYVPAGRQPLKLGRVQSSGEHRLAMLRLALRDFTQAYILTYELDRAAQTRVDSPTYTVDTLAYLRKELGEHVEMRLLIGGDSLRELDRWRDWQRVVELAPPVVMVRPPDTPESLLSQLSKEFNKNEWERRIVELPAMDISATRVRQRAAAGLPLEGLVSSEVEEYIRSHQLYGAI